MNLHKILDAVNVQGYRINNPTKSFKKLFPKKYVLSLDLMGEHVVFNSDEIPKNFSLYLPIGYIFTYNESLPKFLASDKLKYKNVGGVFPSCLDEYFTGTEDKIDLILSICPRFETVPATFINEIIVQCNSEQIMKGNLRNNVMSIVNNYLKDDELDVEHWVRKVVFNYPMNSNGLPVSYPRIINDKSFKNVKLKFSDVFVLYDFRAKSYDKEDKLIVALEDAFEDLNKKIVVCDTYNGMLKKLMKALDEKKLKYKIIDEDRIEVKAKFIHEVNLSFQITDFI